MDWHVAWYHCVHVSHATPFCCHVTGISHVPQGYLEVLLLLSMSNEHLDEELLVCELESDCKSAIIVCGLSVSVRPKSLEEAEARTKSVSSVRDSGYSLILTSTCVDASIMICLVNTTWCFFGH